MGRKLNEMRPSNVQPPQTRAIPVLRASARKLAQRLPLTAVQKGRSTRSVARNIRIGPENSSCATRGKRRKRVLCLPKSGRLPPTSTRQYRCKVILTGQTLRINEILVMRVTHGRRCRPVYRWVNARCFPCLGVKTF